MKRYPVTRQAIIKALIRALEPLDFVRAAWLGGSDATGRTDEWSDIDLLVVAEDATVEETASAVTMALASLSPLAHRYRLPPPTPHGHFQEFLSLRDADPCHVVDCVVMQRSSRDLFLEPERHGIQAILFDKDGIVRPMPLDREAHAARVTARRDALRAAFPLFQAMVKKAVHRRDLADAWYAYLACTLRPLVELARIRHCPERFDYGFRYFDRDLPGPVRQEIESLLLPRSVDDIRALRDRAEELFLRLMREVDESEEMAPRQ